MTTERRDDPKGLPSIMADGTKVFYDDRPVVERGVERRKAERRVLATPANLLREWKENERSDFHPDRRSGDEGGSGAAVEGEMAVASGSLVDLIAREVECAVVERTNRTPMEATDSEIYYTRARRILRAIASLPECPPYFADYLRVEASR